MENGQLTIALWIWDQILKIILMREIVVYKSDGRAIHLKRACADKACHYCS